MRSWTAVLCLLVLATPAVAQSLGDAARKEHERREKIEKTEPTARTIKDEDLPSHKDALDEAPTADAGTSEGEDKNPDGDRFVAPIGFRLPEGLDTTPRNGEDYWRGRVAEARARVESARYRYDSLDRQIRIGQPAMYDSNGQRVMYSSQQMKKRADAAEAELRAAEAALENLYTEARRAGALPGWLR